VAVHLKPVRSSKFAGPRCRAGIRRPGEGVGRGLRQLADGDAVRRAPLPGRVRGRRAPRASEGFRIRRQGGRERRLEPANQQRFKDDLRRAVVRRLAGEHVAGLDLRDVATAAVASSDGPSRFPSLPLTDINGRAIDPASLGGHVVVVEMWATWCPPCRSTLAWLDTFQRAHRDRVTVVAVAVDSTADDVRQMLSALNPAYRVVMGTPPVIEAFGAVAAVPKLFVFDAAGARAEVFYGAPPDLHERIERAVAKALPAPSARP
jgi:thiol-disulfide isomerase/thioredoxin